jgi:hypothetical protein
MEVAFSVSSSSVFLYIYIYLYKWPFQYLYTYTENGTILPFQMEKEAQVISPNLFIIDLLCKWKFVVCLFVSQEKNGRCLFANRLTDLAIRMQ